jgi:transcriptional antiterminator Rof (Rho-off)
MLALGFEAALMTAVERSILESDKETLTAWAEGESRELERDRLSGVLEALRSSDCASR